MTEQVHTQIYDAHSLILNEVKSDVKLLLSKQADTDKKIGSLEIRIDKINSIHTTDNNTIRNIIQCELEKIETKFEKSLILVHKKIDKTDENIINLEKFKSELNGKIYGMVFAVGGIFAVVSFLITKFV